MYWATLETRNYSFTAFGFTPEHALETLRETWEEHARLTDAWLTWEELAPDVATRFTRIGDGWCDYDLLVRGNQLQDNFCTCHQLTVEQSRTLVCAWCFANESK